jgi:hypothetical protein
MALVIVEKNTTCDHIIDNLYLGCIQLMIYENIQRGENTMNINNFLTQ